MKVFVILFFLNKIACAIINTVNSPYAYNLKVRDRAPQLSKPEGSGLVKQLPKQKYKFYKKDT
jgi:hypothetical protein